MKNLLKITLLGIGILNAQESTKPTDSIQKLEPVFINSQVIFGSKYEAKNRTGSSYYLSPGELEKFSYRSSNEFNRSSNGARNREITNLHLMDERKVNPFVYEM